MTARVREGGLMGGIDRIYTPARIDNYPQDEIGIGL